MSANIDDYAEFTDAVWKDPPEPKSSAFEKELAICALGLTGEAGEVSEKIKKLLHYGRTINKDEIVKELGDVVYYWARLCKLVGVFPSDVLTENEDKLYSRKVRGVLHGEGSNR